MDARNVECLAGSRVQVATEMITLTAGETERDIVISDRYVEV